MNFCQSKGYSVFENGLILQEHHFVLGFFFLHFTVPQIVFAVIRYTNKVTGLYFPLYRNIFGNAHCSLRKFEPAKEYHESCCKIG